MTLYLVADTNLFFECKPIEEIDWRSIGVDHIIILLTKPVLDEIDKHKKANGRTRDRAISTFKRIRGMVTGSTDTLLIQETDPKVEMSFLPRLVPDPDHGNVLDYSRNDDRLIGILSSLCKGEETRNVRLLTHDTGPAATAHGLGLPVTMIEDSWLRPAAETSDGKRVRELEQQLAGYASQEPLISIGGCRPADERGNVTVTRRIAKPLTEPEIDELIELLREKHPMQTDFRVPEPNRTTSPRGETIRVEPAGEEEITTYQQSAYPQWLERCRAIFTTLHQGRDELEGPVLLEWSMANDGARPATQVRVEFEAQGPLKLQRILKDDEEDEKDAAPATAVPSARLPSPPRSPQPKRVVETAPAPPKGASLAAANSLLTPSQRVFADLERMNAATRVAGILDQSGISAAVRSMSEISRTARIFDDHTRIFGQPSLHDALGTPGIGRAFAAPIEALRMPKPYFPESHDPEAFYYEWPARKPVSRGALTCDLWRHKSRPQTFEFEVLITKDGDARGSILCTVHADNLTEPKTARIGVQRSIEEFSLLSLAQSLVASCS